MPGIGVTAMTPGIFLASESSIDTTVAPWVAAMARTVGLNSLDENRSMEYACLPWTMSATLYFTCGLPMTLNSLAFFAGAAWAWGSWAALAVSAP